MAQDCVQMVWNTPSEGDSRLSQVCFSAQSLHWEVLTHVQEDLPWHQFLWHHRWVPQRESDPCSDTCLQILISLFRVIKDFSELSSPGNDSTNSYSGKACFAVTTISVCAKSRAHRAKPMLPVQPVLTNSGLFSR